MKLQYNLLGHLMFKYSYTLCIVMFFTCVPSFTLIIAPDYQGKSISGASLCIAPYRNLKINYSGDVTNELGTGDKNQLILDHFNHILSEGLQTFSTFKSWKFAALDNNAHLEKFRLNTNDGFKMNIHLPVNHNTVIRSEGETPDYILFIQDLFLGTEKVEDGAIGSGGWGSIQPDGENQPTNIYSWHTQQFQMSPSPGNFNQVNSVFFKPKHKYLSYRGKFVFWNNRSHKAAVYGRIYVQSRGEGGLVKYITKNNWDDVDRRFVQKLLFGTPFEKRIN